MSDKTTGDVASATSGPSADKASRADRVITIPNAISALRLALIPVFAWLILAHHDLWAIAVLAVASASDWLDGMLARKLNQYSKLGERLDPVADRAYILVTLACLAVRALIPWWLVGVIVLREVVLGIALLVLRSRGFAPWHVHFIGKAGTLALLYAFPLLLLASVSGWVGTVAWVAGWAFALWGVALYWLAGGMYLWQARAALRQ